MRGCLISNRLPTAMPGPSRATRLVTEAVHSGQRSTSLKTSQTTVAGASMSTPQSVIMYQTVHELARRRKCSAPQTTESACANCWTAIPSSNQLNSPQRIHGRTPSLATTPTGYGRFIGRVGALAVALGIGAAIANSPGIAWAQDAPSGASDSSSGASNAGSTTGASASGSTVGASASPASAASGAAEDANPPGDDVDADEDNDEDDDEDERTTTRKRSATTNLMTMTPTTTPTMRTTSRRTTSRPRSISRSIRRSRRKTQTAR